MNSTHDERLSEALRLYRDTLREERPSPQLDTRIEAAITQHVSRRAPSRRAPSRWRVAAWSAAASLAAIAAGVLALRPWSAATIEEISSEPASVPTAAAGTPVVNDPVVNAAAVDMPWHAADLSPWPVDAAIVRVRGSLATDSARMSGNVPRRQYWVDVRLTSDGSMRIVGVEPIYEDF